MKAIMWFEEITKDDVPIVGGKGANLGEMTRAGFPIPPGFVVTADTYFYFIEKTGIKDKIFQLLKDLNVDDTEQLEKTSAKIRNIIISTPMLPEIAEEIKKAYAELTKKVGASPKNPPWVAVRSSATAEDLPDASFAGQQETYLYVRGAQDVIKHVKKCWASLFTARAIYYRAKQGFDHTKVGLAAVVQKMVNSDVSGIMFTAHPVTGEDIIIIEAGWGLGEALVSGMVTPDEYIVDKKSFKILSKKISEQKKMVVPKRNGGTVVVDVPASKRKVQKLPDDKIVALAKIGAQIEKHYGHPQDIEWAMEKGKLYVVQARNITTIGKFQGAQQSEDSDVDAKPILKGLPASPGYAIGKVKIIKDISELDKVQKGDILVTTMTTPDMVPAMQRAAAIVTDEGGMTCHAAIVSRELGIPAVVGTEKATKILKDGETITVDAYKGLVYRGAIKKGGATKKVEVVRPASGAPLLTATQVKVNVAMPEAAERAAATGADGVGLLRAEHMITSTGKHPAWFIENDLIDDLIEAVKKGIRTVAEKFYPKPVWYRTFDARTDEFRNLEGGEKEPHEDNPMLGWHGIRRSLDQPELIMAEFTAIKELHEEGLDNVGVMLPFVIRPEEVVAAKALAQHVGLIPHKEVPFGIMVETPAAALRIEDFIKVGIDFLSFGTNDLTQLTLGIDRNNALVQKHFSELHPAVLDLIAYVIHHAKAAGVETSICGQAGSYPPMVRRLVRLGIDSISANIDAVQKIRETVYREERRLMLEAARKRLFED